MKFFQLKFSSHAKIYLIVLALLVIVFYTFLPFVGTCLLFLLIFVAYFFRDPDKIVPQDENLILSPADGIITFIGPSDPPPETKFKSLDYNKISIFLSIFDIHINRIPTSGKILSCDYVPGKFFNATLKKSSNENERNIISMETKYKNTLVFVQIAGLIARRIISNVKNNQEVIIGDRYGIIKFGSRVDIYIPKKIDLRVLEGQRVIGGETILADQESKFKITGNIKK